MPRRTPRCKRASLALVALLLAASASAGPLDEVPLHDRAYDAFEKVLAFVDYRYPTVTLPLTKGEIAEVLVAIENDPPRRALLARSARVQALYLRLRDRFRREIEFVEHERRNGRFDYRFEWIDTVRARASATDVDGGYSRTPRGECRDCGQAEVDASHGFSIEDYFSVHLEESLRADAFPADDRMTVGLDLARGAAAAKFANVELRAGRDSMWWGTGYHGTLVLSDNAGPLDFVRLGAGRPFFLPSYFRYLGRVDASAFLARLEKEREHPRPCFGGLRVSVSPTGYVDLAVARTILFGGEGVTSPRPADWPAILLGVGEHRFGKTGDTDQLMNLEARVSLAFLRRFAWMPFKELRVGTEYGAESVGEGFVRSVANLWTLYADFGPVDVRAEWANLVTKSPWYRHYVYTDGYTYKGEILGHPIDAASRQWFVQATGYPAPWLHVGGWWEHTTRDYHHVAKAIHAFGLDLRGLLPRRIDVFARSRLWFVDRVGKYYPEEKTTGWRVEVGAEADF